LNTFATDLAKAIGALIGAAAGGDVIVDALAADLIGRAARPPADAGARSGAFDLAAAVGTAETRTCVPLEIPQPLEGILATFPAVGRRLTGLGQGGEVVVRSIGGDICGRARVTAVPDGRVRTVAPPVVERARELERLDADDRAASSEGHRRERDQR
jgi:hypothetical protein